MTIKNGDLGRQCIKDGSLRSGFTTTQLILSAPQHESTTIAGDNYIDLTTGEFFQLLIGGM